MACEVSLTSFLMTTLILNSLPSLQLPFSRLDALHDTDSQFLGRQINRPLSHFPYALLFYTYPGCDLGRHLPWKIQVRIHTINMYIPITILIDWLYLKNNCNPIMCVRLRKRHARRGGHSRFPSTNVRDHLFFDGEFQTKMLTQAIFLSY